LSECNYLYGNYSTKKRVTVLKEMLQFSGIEEERLRASWVSSAEAPELVHEFNTFIEELRKLGPSPLRTDYRKELA
jgi:F420-non-reducing hydrogenase iron-sulfur subunit